MRWPTGSPDFAGSALFLALHVAWFAAWIVINVSPGIGHFDPFPFTFLTLVVSLEAIFLSSFILISQKRAALISERRNQLDLQINLLTEQENTRMLKVLGAIANKLERQRRRRSERQRSSSRRRGPTSWSSRSTARSGPTDGSPSPDGRRQATGTSIGCGDGEAGYQTRHRRLAPRRTRMADLKTRFDQAWPTRRASRRSRTT